MGGQQVLASRGHRPGIPRATRVRQRTEAAGLLAPYWPMTPFFNTRFLISPTGQPPHGGPVLALKPHPRVPFGAGHTRRSPTGQENPA